MGYTDVDWAGDQIDRKSVSGHVFFLGVQPHFMGRKKQSCVTLSTMEAVLVSLARAAQEMHWWCKLEVPRVLSGGRQEIVVVNMSVKAFSNGTTEGVRSVETYCNTLERESF